MTLYPKIQLSRLRDIGWKLWDPIGLADNEGSPSEGYTNEYDSYLLHVVSMICRGGSKNDAAAYLNGIASNHIGRSFIHPEAAVATSHAIAEYLTSLPDGPKTVS